MNLIKEKSVWFDIPKDPGKGKLKIKYLNPGQMQELLQGVSEAYFATKAGEKEGETRITSNTVKSREVLIVARIEDWDNMRDDDCKTKLECNDENKIKFSCIKGFTDIVDVMVEKLDKMVEEETKKEAKNSRSSQSG